MRYRWIYWILGGVVLLAVPQVVKDDYFMHMFIMTAVFMILAVSLDLIYGYAGQLNLGHASFAAIGAYLTGLLMIRLGISYWLALPLSAAGTSFISLLVGFPTSRLKGIFLGLTTLGFGEIVRLVLLVWYLVTRGPMGLPGIPSPTLGSFVFETKTSFFYLVVALLLVTIYVTRRVVHSRMGIALQAIRDDEIAARAMGIHSAYYKVVVFMLGTFFAGVAGSFYAVYISFISPDSFKMMDSFMIFAMTILGGMGTLAGPLIGALIIYVMPEATRAFAEYRMIWVGVLLMVTMIVQPLGILGGVQSMTERLRRRKSAAQAG
jgi:branched-chain amino acid transport system permease protein